MATFENSNVAKIISSQYPANTKRGSDVDLMLGHRLRRSLNIKSTLVQRVLSAGISSYRGNIELIGIRKPELINDTTRYDYHSSIKTGGSPTNTRRSDYVGCMIRFNLTVLSFVKHTFVALAEDECIAPDDPYHVV